jgi:hypothetical protein
VNARVSGRTSATPDRRAGDSVRVGLSQSGYLGRIGLQARGFPGNYGFQGGCRHTYWRGRCGILRLWYRVRKIFCRCSRVGSQERRWKAERTGAQGVLRHRGWTRGVGNFFAICVGIEEGEPRRAAAEEPYINRSISLGHFRLSDICAG